MLFRSVSKTPRQLFEGLLAARLHGDALQVLPHLVPKRVAVWWGCVCSWGAYRLNAPENAIAALQTAVRWVAHPTEENRRKAEAAGQATDMTSSAGALAMAAFWSGGSVSRPDLPEVPPPPDLTARTVAGAVLLAGVERDPLEFERHYCRFLALGRQIMEGRHLWPGAVPTSAPERVNGQSPETPPFLEAQLVDTHAIV